MNKTKRFIWIGEFVIDLNDIVYIKFLEGNKGATVVLANGSVELHLLPTEVAQLEKALLPWTNDGD